MVRWSESGAIPMNSASTAHSVATPSGLAEGRLLSLDALRGFAMVLVILQHSYLSVAPRLMVGWRNFALWYVTHLAAIAFVSISGATFSYHLFAKEDWTVVYKKVVVRAFFFLIVVHFAINLASHYFLVSLGSSIDPNLSLFQWLVCGMPITDVIGLCLLISPALILHLNTKIRAVLVVAMLAASTLIATYWHPEDYEQRLIAEVLVGSRGEPTWFWWPLFPWLAIFVSGSFVGRALSRLRMGLTNAKDLVIALTKWGFLLFTFSIVLVLLYEVLKAVFAGESHADLLYALYPRRTTLLLPAYFAILVWLFAGLLYVNNVKKHFTRSQWMLSVIGRTSLFVFVAQYLVVEDIPAFFGFAGSLDISKSLLLFLLGSIVLWSCAYLYGRWRGWIPRGDYLKCVALIQRGFSVR